MQAVPEGWGSTDVEPPLFSPFLAEAT